MADLDDDIDRLYQGPLGAFIDQRNALAKATKRPDVKALVKPGLPAWAVNQVFWHHRDVVTRLEAASLAVREAHQAALAGRRADIAGAEQAHRDALRDATTCARDVLLAGGLSATAATLDAVRETLSALPSPEANGRLVTPLQPRGLDALAGLVLAARVPGPAATPPPAVPRSVPPAMAATTTTTPADAAARARADRDRAKAVEAAAREREAARARAQAALDHARAALAAADAAVDQAERDLVTRQAERVSARDTLKRAQRTVEELSFGR